MNAPTKLFVFFRLKKARHSAPGTSDVLWGHRGGLYRLAGFGCGRRDRLALRDGGTLSTPASTQPRFSVTNEKAIQ
jgi:hypothetical protein